MRRPATTGPTCVIENNPPAVALWQMTSRIGQKAAVSHHAEGRETRSPSHHDSSCGAGLSVASAVAVVHALSRSLLQCSWKPMGWNKPATHEQWSTTAQDTRPGSLADNSLGVDRQPKNLVRSVSCYPILPGDESDDAHLE